MGAAVAEAQGVLDESRTRALHLEGVAQEIHDRVCEQIQQLKSMVESLYQACQSKDQKTFGLSNDLGTLQNEVTLVQSQLQIQVSKCSDYERILGHKDSEIKRLMTELDVVNQSLVSLREMREQLEASLAASSASRIGDRAEEVSVPVCQSVQPVVVESQSTNNLNNAFLKHFHLCQPMPVHLHGRNGAGPSSLPTKGYPNEPFGGDAGDYGEVENDDKMMMKKNLFKMVPHNYRKRNR